MSIALDGSILAELQAESRKFARRAVLAVVLSFVLIAVALGTLAGEVATQFSSKDARLNQQSAVIATAVSDIVHDCAVIRGLGGECPNYVAQLRSLDPLLGS